MGLVIINTNVVKNIKFQQRKKQQISKGVIIDYKFHNNINFNKSQLNRLKLLESYIILFIFNKEYYKILILIQFIKKNMRLSGLEPDPTAWKEIVLPLHHRRKTDNLIFIQYIWQIRNLSKEVKENNIFRTDNQFTISDSKNYQFDEINRFGLKKILSSGVEPESTMWRTVVIPLYHDRFFFQLNYHQMYIDYYLLSLNTFYKYQLIVQIKLNQRDLMIDQSSLKQKQQKKYQNREHEGDVLGNFRVSTTPYPYSQ
ncbi:hypothetical protein pb186bvf_006928 [Paramecium bursaria]